MHDPETTTPSPERSALETIRDVTETVHRGLDFRAVAEHAVASVLSYTPFAAASILVLDDKHETLELMAARGFSEELLGEETSLPFEGSLTGEALRAGRVILSDAFAEEPRGVDRMKRTLAREGFRRALLVPLIHGDVPLGSLNLVVRADHVLTEDSLETLLSIGRTVALALANARHVESLRRNERRYAIATAAARVGVWDWDLVSGRFYLDANVKAVLGYADEEIPNDLEIWSKYIHPEDAPRVGAEIEAYLASGRGEFVCEHRMLHKDGSIRWILARGDAVRDADGKVVRMVGTDVDITERKLLEDERHALQEQLLHAEKLKSLGIMAGGIAHDFNNLLTTIMGNAHLALEGMPEDSQLRKSVEQIDTAARRAAELTQQLLAYSGRGALAIQTVDLSRLVEEMTDLMRVSVSRKALLECTVGEGLPAVEGDPTQLRQVVMNLIKNASDALGTEGGRVRVSTGLAHSPVGSPGRRVFVAISDNGRGMSEEERNRIFDPFYTTKLDGRGLGLAAVQGIVQGHRGSLQVESAPGRGTTVTVILPATERPATPMRARAGYDAVDMGGGVVLVADDEEGIRRLAQRVLEGAGLKVLAASNGVQALETFSRFVDDVRLVLLDVSMPGMSGYEALRRIRGVRKDVPIILSSGFPGQVEDHDVPGDGSVLFLPKPYGPSSLMEKVRVALLDDRSPT